MDDPSPSVQEALTTEFERLGDAGYTILKRLARDSDIVRAEMAEKILVNIKGPHPAAEMIRFIRSLQYDLETGLFLINRVVQPELQIEDLRAPLDRLGGRVNELTSPPASPWERCKIINRVLFHEQGFRGNIEDYEDPANSHFESVLRRRKGIPVSLSLLYILVAQRAGFDLDPIGLPGHFLVGCFHASLPFYIDPFERGRFRSVTDLRLQLRESQSDEALQWLAPSPIGEVLCRVCRNLVHHYDLKGNARLSRQFTVFVREFEETHRRHSEA